MTIRILADREPYSSFADDSSALSIVNGPAALDAPGADFIVIPAEDLLRIDAPCLGASRSSRFIAYGPVSLMGAAFGAGAADYLREPWSIPELRARLGRLLPLRFACGEARLRIEGSMLRGRGSALLSEAELSFLRLLLSCAPLPVTRAAASLAAGRPSSDRGLGRLASSLRLKLDEAEPGLGRRLRMARGLGYRLEVRPVDNLCED